MDWGTNPPLCEGRDADVRRGHARIVRRPCSSLQLLIDPRSPLWRMTQARFTALYHLLNRMQAY